MAETWRRYPFVIGIVLLDECCPTGWIRPATCQMLRVIASYVSHCERFDLSFGVVDGRHYSSSAAVVVLFADGVVATPVPGNIAMVVWKSREPKDDDDGVESTAEVSHRESIHNSHSKLPLLFIFRHLATSG